MSKEDKIRFSFLLIVTIIVMAMNIQIVTTTNRRGLTMLDSMFDNYLVSTAQSWAAAPGETMWRQSLSLLSLALQRFNAAANLKGRCRDPARAARGRGVLIRAAAREFDAGGRAFAARRSCNRLTQLGGGCFLRV